MCAYVGVLPLPASAGKQSGTHKYSSVTRANMFRRLRIAILIRDEQLVADENRDAQVLVLAPSTALAESRRSDIFALLARIQILKVTFYVPF